jgi:hypothetical protein
LIVLAGAAYAVPAVAADLDASGSLSGVDVHGFVSQGYIKSTGSDYLAQTKNAGSFDFTEAGINFTKQLTDRFRLGLQLFAYDLGQLGQYHVSADWYYLDYHFRDAFGIRAGRLKMPLGLYNDIADIDAARVPILLPNGLYPSTNREFLLAQTGVEVYGYLKLGRAGALDYRAFGGSLQIDPVDLPNQAGSLTPISSYGVPYVGGGRLAWETPLDGLKVEVTAAALRAEASAVLLLLWPGAGNPAPTLNEREDLYLAVGSVEYAAHDLLLQAEYSQQRSELTTDNQAVVPNVVLVSEAGYGLAAYRISRWLQPAAYYSFSHPNRNVWSGRENFQDDLAGTLRFDINSFWIVKVEAHYMRGTASINAVMSDGAPVDKTTAPENWGLFLVKTTGYC